MTDEAVAAVEKFVQKHGITYPIVSSKEAMRTYGIKAVPTKFLLNVEGKVVGSSSNAQTIEGLLKDVDLVPALEYSKKFDGVLKLVRAGDYAKAAPELAKLEKDTGKDGENAKAVSAWIEKQGEKRLASADAARDGGEIFSARDDYAEVERRWPGKGEAVKGAKARLEALKKDKDAKKALGVEKVFQEAVACEKAKDTARAAACYAKCAKACAGTKFGDRCAQKAKELGG